jgi:hypothetical protein
VTKIGMCVCCHPPTRAAISTPNYDVTREGRFIMLRRCSHGSSLRVVIHSAEELKQILAAGGVR